MTKIKDPTDPTGQRFIEVPTSSLHNPGGSSHNEKKIGNSKDLMGVTSYSNDKNETNIKA